VSDANTDVIVSWSADGCTFIVWSPGALVRHKASASQRKEAFLRAACDTPRGYSRRGACIVTWHAGGRGHSAAGCAALRGGWHALRRLFLRCRDAWLTRCVLQERDVLPKYFTHSNFASFVRCASRKQPRRAPHATRAAL
jgi:hypothetical protein